MMLGPRCRQHGTERMLYLVFHPASVACRLRALQAGVWLTMPLPLRHVLHWVVSGMTRQQELTQAQVAGEARDTRPSTGSTQGSA